MAARITQQTVHTLDIQKFEEIDAPLDIVFEALLEQLGPDNEGPDHSPIPMVLEPRPGGRWFRDLGDGAGHFWGTVQAIRPPTLLEICGPLFMSYPAVSNVQFRLADVSGATQLRFVHRAMAQIAHDPAIESAWAHIETGWANVIERVVISVGRRKSAARAGAVGAMHRR